MIVFYFLIMISFWSFFFVSFLKKVWEVSTPHKRDESTKKMIKIYQKEADFVSERYKTINGITMRIRIITSAILFKRSDVIYIYYRDICKKNSDIERKRHFLECLEARLKSWDTKFSSSSPTAITTSY